MPTVNPYLEVIISSITTFFCMKGLFHLTNVDPDDRSLLKYTLIYALIGFGGVAVGIHTYFGGIEDMFIMILFAAIGEIGWFRASMLGFMCQVIVLCITLAIGYILAWMYKLIIIG